MKLPETWQKVRLADVCRINPRLELPEAPKDDLQVSFVPMASVDEIDGRIVTLENKCYKEVSKGFTPFQEGDVLFAKITPSMENGKAAIAKGLTNGIGFGSTEFHVIRPSEHLLAEYIFYFIRQNAFRDYAKSAFIGSAGQQRVPAIFLERLKIPLPPRPEQQRIADILRQADELRRLRREIMDRVYNLYISIFLEKFGDPLSNPKSYKKVRLGNLGQLDRGISKHRPRDATFLLGGKYPLIQTGDVTNSGGWITRYSQTYSDAGLAQSRLWPKGTLCITIAANIARTGILTFDACFPDSVVGFTPNEQVTSEYVMFAITLYQKIIESRASESAQKNINLQVLNSLRLPVPPINDQVAFSAQVNEVRQIVEGMEKSDRDIESLIDVCLHEAFVGDLTASWRQIHSQESHGHFNIIRKTSIEFRERLPEHRSFQSQTNRVWLKNQLSELQGCVWKAMQEWKGTLIPSQDIEEFAKSWPLEQYEKANDQLLRTLNQLAELGLIAEISVRNDEGNYVLAYRGFREEELSRSSEIEILQGLRG